MENITLFSSFTVAFIWLVLAVHLLTSERKSHPSARLMGLNAILWAHQNAVLVLSYFVDSPVASVLRPSLAMVLGPALYIFYTSCVKNILKFSLQNLYHVLPACAVSAILILNIDATYFAIDYLIIASLLLYSGAILVALAISGGTELERLGSNTKDTYLWIYILAGMMLISALGDIAILAELRFGKDLFDSQAMLVSRLGFLLFSGFALLSFMGSSSLAQKLFDLSEKRRQKYSQSKLTTAICEAHFSKLNRYLAENTPHLQGMVKIAEVSEALQIPSRQLSETINRMQETSFSRYLNDLRISEAKLKLTSSPHLSVTEIMYETGFTAKSNFNKEFLRVEGVSPSTYREILMTAR